MTSLEPAASTGTSPRPGPARVMVVDDSAVVRSLVGAAVEADPALTLVGVASNGRLALERLDLLDPDVVVLDIEMPELDGLATLVELKRRRRGLPVVMFSSLTSQGAAATVEALARGASDFACKPSNLGDLDAVRRALAGDLIVKVRQLCPRPAPPPAAPVDAHPATPSGATARVPRPTRVGGLHASAVLGVVVACSTGGPNALSSFLSGLPAAFPVPVLVVQHMPATFTRLLAARLDREHALTIREAGEAESVRAGDVLIAPGDRHLEIAGSAAAPLTRVHDGPQENSVRPAADVLFRSAARLWGRGTLAVVLTGMGADGLRGARAVHEAGGTVLAQDQASSVVWGMPGQVAGAGLADLVASPLELAAAVLQRTARPHQRLAARGAP